MVPLEDRDWSQVRHRWGVALSILMALLALLSLIRVERGETWAFQFEVTTTTALFVGLAAIPLLLERLLERRGSLRLPGGIELDLAGREPQEVGLPGLAATRHEVDARLTRLEGEYQRWRGTRPSWQRSQHLERILAEARLLSGAATDRVGARVADFADARDGHRAVTLALLEGSLDIPGETEPAVVGGLRSPRSNFEEYHLLKVAELHGRRFRLDDRRALLELLSERLSDKKWAPGSDRRTLARRIVGVLSASDPG